MFHQNESTFVGHFGFCSACNKLSPLVTANSNSSTAQPLTSSKVSRLKASIVLYPWEVRFQIKAGEFPLQRIIYTYCTFHIHSLFIIIYHYLSVFIIMCHYSSTTFRDDLDWFGGIISNQTEQQLPSCVHLPHANRSGSRPKLVESWWTFYIEILSQWLDSRPWALQNMVSLYDSYYMSQFITVRLSYQSFHLLV